jgi:GAF domain-containing protein
MVVPVQEEAALVSARWPSERIDDATSVNEIAQRVVDYVSPLFGVDFTSLYIWDGAAGVLKLAAFRHQAHWAPQQIFTPGNGVVGTVLLRGVPLLVADYHQLRTKSPRAVRQGVASALGVPVNHNGELLAVVELGGRVPNRFTPADAQLLERIAAEAAPALYRALHGAQAEVRPVAWHSMARAS